ncbi:MAG: hypothetical protein JSU65_03220, partial [Candidatus Zixiibacteriota bacterium]
MKHLNLLCVLLTFILSGRAAGEVMSPEEQRNLISMYQYVTGQIDRLPASVSTGWADEERPIKCGTPVILEFWDNYGNFDPALLAATPLSQVIRPILPDSFDTPGGNIRVHFAVAGDDAVYQAGVDSDGDGVPDFVESVGRIADSVYDYTINVLGYPPPLVDTLCDNGGDERVDIYLVELGGSVFGQTWADTLCAQGPSYQHSPGWVEIDNDYQEPGFGSYVSRPLDAVRVTLAHEFFHTIHFSLDRKESRALYEMSAVWMEEEQYDHINDYYIWLPVFYNHPRVSLQSENAPI